MDAEWFWSQIDRRGPDECWPWRGRLTVRGGYGIFYGDGKHQRAHRTAFALTNGPLLPGLVVRHTCDNPPCCNPAHLLQGTQRDNMQDAVSRNRMRHHSGDRHWTHHQPDRLARSERNGSRLHPERLRRGEKHGRAKLSDQQTRTVRERIANGERRTSLAREYNVSLSTIAQIANGRRSIFTT